MSDTSFATTIRPLFRDKDVQSMSKAFDLSSYDDVRAHADAILGALASGKMPCDGAWPDEKVALIRAWIAEGFPR
jgi:hypothetical protein